MNIIKKMKKIIIKNSVLILLTQIKINKENDPHFSDNYFNSYLIKDKYIY